MKPPTREAIGAETEGLYCRDLVQLYNRITVRDGVNPRSTAEMIAIVLYIIDNYVANPSQ